MVRLNEIRTFIGLLLRRNSSAKKKNCRNKFNGNRTATTIAGITIAASTTQKNAAKINKQQRYYSSIGSDTTARTDNYCKSAPTRGYNSRWWTMNNRKSVLTCTNFDLVWQCANFGTRFNILFGWLWCLAYIIFTRFPRNVSRKILEYSNFLFWFLNLKNCLLEKFVWPLLTLCELLYMIKHTSTFRMY